MCGRYSFVGISDVCGRFRVTDPSIGFRSHFNIAPGSTNPVIVMHERVEAVMMQWGLVPRRTKDLRITPRPINARAESIEERPVFCDLLSSNRCLVPASGFFEWKQEGKKRIPFYVRLKDEPVFAFAGLCDTWKTPEGIPLSTYAIITTVPNALLAPVHDRMPVILRPKDEDRWLSGEVLSGAGLKEILSPYPPDAMEAYAVPDRVNNPGVDDPGIIEPVQGLGSFGG